MIRQLKPALIFLDVQIPGADGFGVLEEVADRRDLPAVVFVTAHREYAIPAFEAQALDYLLKPFQALPILRSFGPGQKPHPEKHRIPGSSKK
jgi:two-component system LytT family response regulator/two-component system response regulator LytT